MGGGEERKSYPTSEDRGKLLWPRALPPDLCECPLPSPAPPVIYCFCKEKVHLWAAGEGWSLDWVGLEDAPQGVNDGVGGPGKDYELLGRPSPRAPRALRYPATGAALGVSPADPQGGCMHNT